MKRKLVVSAAIVLITYFFSLGFEGSGPAAVSAAGQRPSGPFKAPDTIDFRSANIMSEGVRLHAELFSQKSLAGKQLPTIIQAHGWGGTAAGFRRDAID